MKKNNNRVDPFTNEDFNFRVSFQIEDNIYHNSSIISTLLEKWEQLQKVLSFNESY